MDSDFEEYCEKYLLEFSADDRLRMRKQIKGTYHYHFYLLNKAGEILKKEFIKALPNWLIKIFFKENK